MRCIQGLDPLTIGDERLREWCDEFGFTMNDVKSIEVCNAQGHFDGIAVRWYAKDGNDNRYIAYDPNADDGWSAAINITHIRVGEERAKSWLRLHEVSASELRTPILIHNSHGRIVGTLHTHDEFGPTEMEVYALP